MHEDDAWSGIITGSAGHRGRPRGPGGSWHVPCFRDRSNEAFTPTSVQRCSLTLCFPWDGFVLTLTPISAPPSIPAPVPCACPSHGPTHTPHGSPPPLEPTGALLLSLVSKCSQPGRPGSCPLHLWKASRPRSRPLLAPFHRPAPLAAKTTLFHLSQIILHYERCGL